MYKRQVLETPNIGVRCRHPYDPVAMAQMPMPDPAMGETDVTVTGVMGVENGARFFWVQSWEQVVP